MIYRMRFEKVNMPFRVQYKEHISSPAGTWLGYKDNVGHVPSGNGVPYEFLAMTPCLYDEMIDVCLAAYVHIGDNGPKEGVEMHYWNGEYFDGKGSPGPVVGRMVGKEHMVVQRPDAYYYLIVNGVDDGNTERSAPVNRSVQVQAEEADGTVRHRKRSNHNDSDAH